MHTFPSAEEARTGARNNLIIHTEIRDIEAAILAAIEDGELEVELSTSTMTNAADGEDDHPLSFPYYRVWRGDVENRALKDQMDQVILHFSDLGYTITRKLNTETEESFYWEVLW